MQGTERAAASWPARLHAHLPLTHTHLPHIAKDTITYSGTDMPCTIIMVPACHVQALWYQLAPYKYSGTGTLGASILVLPHSVQVYEAWPIVNCQLSGQ